MTHTAPHSLAPLSLATATADDFEPVRGQTFRLALPDGDFDMRLHDVQRHGASRRAGGAFTLTFVGALGPYLPQAIYSLAHEDLGTLETFLVPIGPVDGGNGYEAVFA